MDRAVLREGVPPPSEGNKSIFLKIPPYFPVVPDVFPVRDMMLSSSLGIIGRALETESESSGPPSQALNQEGSSCDSGP